MLKRVLLAAAGGAAATTLLASSAVAAGTTPTGTDAGTEGGLDDCPDAAAACLWTGANFTGELFVLHDADDEIEFAEPTSIASLRINADTPIGLRSGGPDEDYGLAIALHGPDTVADLAADMPPGEEMPLFDWAGPMDIDVIGPPGGPGGPGGASGGDDAGPGLELDNGNGRGNGGQVEHQATATASI